MHVNGKMRLALIFCLFLASCGAQQAREARTWAPGHTLADLEQCMGPPDKADVRDGTTVAMWSYVEPSRSMALPLADLALLPVSLPISLAGAGSTSPSTSGDCRAIATLRDWHVVSLRYAGADDGITGHDAVCAPIVRGCLRP
jgi:hypothetical protein